MKNYGPSGTVQVFDAFCVLPVNIMNEKIFIFLWFWYIIIAVLTGVSILVRIATLISSTFRLFLLRRMIGKEFERARVEMVFRRCQVRLTSLYWETEAQTFALTRSAIGSYWCWSDKMSTSGYIKTWSTILLDISKGKSFKTNKRKEPSNWPLAIVSHLWNELTK